VDIKARTGGIKRQKKTRTAWGGSARIRVHGLSGGMTLEEEERKPQRHPLNPALSIIHNLSQATVNRITDASSGRVRHAIQMLFACFSAKPM